MHKPLIKSSPPSAAYLHQWISWASLQIMACCLFGTKPLSEPMLYYCQLQWNHNQNTKLFIQKNACKNIVCETAAILFNGIWVNDNTQEAGSCVFSFIDTRVLPKDYYMVSLWQVPGWFNQYLQCYWHQIRSFPSENKSFQWGSKYARGLVVLN